ncbi:hypothetical protein MMC26_005271 [Xylographa opegraphella]|nr:hypothetical protein [Xylographa opegraphella]
MDDAGILASEVLRVIAAPYAVSLKALYSVLRSAAPVTIHHWAQGHRCQIDALASAVLEELPLWPYTLEIIERLSVAISIRNAFLRLDPKLLPNLLQKANITSGEEIEASDQRARKQEHSKLSYQQVTKTCVSMLSVPLPADYPVPAALPAFVLRILEGVVRSPSAATLELMYTVLKGVGSDLFQVLPLQKSTHLQDQLIKLLRNFDDHKVNLLCLAIFALLCSNQPVCPVREEHPSLPGSQALKANTEGPLPDFCCAARLFFALKAQKTLELVVLRSIMLCSSSVTPSDASSGLRLAREILDTIDSIERRNWVQKNILKVRKLQEKVRNSDIDCTVRLLAFEVIAALSEAETLPDDLIATLEGLLQQLPLSYDANQIWKGYAVNFSKAFMESQISRALRAAAEINQLSMDYLVELNDMRLFVGNLVKLVTIDSTMGQTLLGIISSHGIRNLISRLLLCTLTQAENITKHGRQEACTAHITEVRWLLGRDICVLLLKSALFTTPKPLAIDPLLATSLLESATYASGMNKSCDSFPLTSATFKPVVLVSSRKSPDSSAWNCSQDWRAALKEDLDADAACRHEFVVRRVNEVCRDLELRCNNTENPLKEEQERSKSLAHELQICQTSCAKLEGEARENRLVLESLQMERVQLVNQNLTAESSAQGLSEALDQLRLKLKLTNQEAEDASIIAKELLRQQELSHCAAMTAKDELVELEARRVGALESKVAVVEAELRSAECEYEAVSVKVAEMYETVKEREAKITELENSVASFTLESNHQIDALKKNAVETEKLKCQLSEMRSEVEALTLREKQRDEDFNQVISELEKKHVHELATSDAVILQQRFEHERAVTALRNELATTLRETARLTEMHDGHIGELLGKLETLQTERAVRAKEFAQAQDLSGKLMALMGRRSGPPATTSFSTTSEEDIQVSPQPSSLGSSTSSKKNRSAAKWASAQPKFKAPTIPLKRLSTDNTTLGYSMRHPLEDLDVHGHNDEVVVRDQNASEQENCELSSESFVQTINHKENLLPHDMHGCSFTDSHVFTSTDHHSVED